MKKITLLLSIPFALLFLRCGDESSDMAPTDVANDTKKESFDARVNREVREKLSIPANEKYTVRIYREYINSDTIKDAIITVNRMDFAMNEAIRTKKEAKMAELGFIGNYNFFLYYDGELDKISVPLPVPSSPGRELDVQFKSILSPTRKDIIIDYRIRNSGWRSYFSVLNERDLALVFQWKMFDNIGNNTPEALFHDIVQNPDGITYDIAIFSSDINGYNKNIPDIYQYVPSITNKKELLYKFFFDRSGGKFRLYPEYTGNINRLKNGEEGV